jgi:arsenical pump membrane protein
VRAAFDQAWPAFALVAGLLLVGAAAADDGLFGEIGAFVARAPGGGRTLLVGLLLAEAVVAVVLNLDTAVVFMTPVLLQAARARGLREDAFLYGAVFMANSASLLLPGSNLTNLIVLADRHVSGSHFAARLALPWLVSVAATLVFVALVVHRGGHAGEEPQASISFRPRLGTAGVLIATVLVLALARPELPVLALGLVVAALSRTSLRAANPPLLIGVLAAAVVLGAIVRSVGVGPLEAGPWETAWLAVGAAAILNNLPAAVLLAAHAPAHPRALLLGLDLGPNLVVTGSLSAIFWLQVARANGARPSIRRYSAFGVALVPLTLCASLLVTRL